TVAHSMATITVQAGSALHVLSAEQDDRLRDALLAIRQTSKSALGEMRAVLGQLRGDDGADGDSSAAAELGLDRLPELSAAVTAAGSPVHVSVEGERGPLPSAVDHAAYRILQESLTNVLRHAESGTPAHVCLRYTPDSVEITVSNNGHAPAGAPQTPASATQAVSSPGAGNGLRGMRERATATGGHLEAGPSADGGFIVTAKLPRRTGAAPGSLRAGAPA
ncbi:MAG TPA: ATP-binding protein, partial [Trebonia sp.]|nr:ATP-binding protein [Trebonia sp.]